MNRGHRGGSTLLYDTDRRRFLGLVEELRERFRVEVHAFVLMDNQYHLLLPTLEPNLGHAVRWLNVSYAVSLAGLRLAEVVEEVDGLRYQAKAQGALMQPFRKSGAAVGLWRLKRNISNI